MFSNNPIIILDQHDKRLAELKLVMKHVGRIQYHRNAIAGVKRPLAAMASRG